MASGSTLTQPYDWLCQWHGVTLSACPGDEAPSVAADVVMEAARDFGKRANRADKFGYGEEVTEVE